MLSIKNGYFSIYFLSSPTMDFSSLPCPNTTCSKISLIRQSTHLSPSTCIKSIYYFFQKAPFCSNPQRFIFLPIDKVLVHVLRLIYSRMFICSVIILLNWTALKTNDFPSLTPSTPAPHNVFFPGIKCLLHPLQTHHNNPHTLSAPCVTT